MLIFLYSGLLGACTLGCQSSDRKAITLRDNGAEGAAGAALVAFSSAADDSVQIHLQLSADSTFQLALSSPERSASRNMQGKLTITDDHYRLFFPDTVAQFNELITPIHHDASIVAYPDGSVALDRALTQFYIRGSLVTQDTLAEKPH